MSLLRRLLLACSSALLPLTHTCIYDARARLVPLYCLRSFWRSRADREAVPQQTLDRIALGLGGTPFDQRPRLSNYFFRLGLVIALAWFIYFAVGAPALGLIPVIAGGLLLALAERFRPLVPPSERDRIARAMIAERLCPSCAYPLAKALAGSDLTTCSECGATWWQHATVVL